MSHALLFRQNQTSSQPESMRRSDDLNIGDSNLECDDAGHSQTRASFAAYNPELEEMLLSHIVMQIDLPTLFTNLTLVFAALKVGPLPYLLWRLRRIDSLSDDRLTAGLYLTSKLSGVLAVAFALSAAASTGRRIESILLSLLLVTAGALTMWTVFKRLSGDSKRSHRFSSGQDDAR